MVGADQDATDAALELDAPGGIAHGEVPADEGAEPAEAA